ncbi:hypothetical protein [Methylococcus mesophilus]|nr:hypothetical protein [Methylococcus mesophilus]UZR29085.1 hypothetical protein OOT43_00230 [Methylococcus mesophilus]
MRELLYWALVPSALLFAFLIFFTLLSGPSTPSAVRFPVWEPTAAASSP